VLIWYIFSGFGIMHQQKSGNPAVDHAAGAALHKFLEQLEHGKISSTDLSVLPDGLFSNQKSKFG
jgi:hypothetical protein